MAHKTRVNGTNYSISGGKTRVNSTNYAISFTTVELITFYIDGFSYQAEPNMTWDYWIGSSYNVDGGVWYWDAYNAIVVDMKVVCYQDGSGVQLSDAIEAGYDYVLYG